MIIVDAHIAKMRGKVLVQAQEATHLRIHSTLISLWMDMEQIVLMKVPWRMHIRLTHQNYEENINLFVDLKDIRSLCLCRVLISSEELLLITCIASF